MLNEGCVSSIRLFQTTLRNTVWIQMNKFTAETLFQTFTLQGHSEHIASQFTKQVSSGNESGEDLW